jgi:hypothetical protein
VPELVGAVFGGAPLIEQAGFGDDGDEAGRGAVGAVEDLVPAEPGRDRAVLPGGVARAGGQQGAHVGRGLEQARQDERHVDADLGGVALEAGELVGEDLVLLLLGLVPPQPGASSADQIL